MEQRARNQEDDDDDDDEVAIRVAREREEEEDDEEEDDEEGDDDKEQAAFATGSTSLHVAAARGNLAEVQRLIEAGEDAAVPDEVRRGGGG